MKIRLLVTRSDAGRPELQNQERSDCTQESGALWFVQSRGPALLRAVASLLMVL